MQRVPYSSDENMELCKFNPEFTAWLRAGKSKRALWLAKEYEEYPPYVASLVRCLEGAILYNLFRKWQSDPSIGVDVCCASREPPASP